MIGVMIMNNKAGYDDVDYIKHFEIAGNHTAPEHGIVEAHKKLAFIYYQRGSKGLYKKWHAIARNNDLDYLIEQRCKWGAYHDSSYQNLPLWK